MLYLLIQEPAIIERRYGRPAGSTNRINNSTQWELSAFKQNTSYTTRRRAWALSVTASIIAVLQLTGDVITYLRGIKGTPKECRKCMVEISNSNTLLFKLDLHLSESSSEEPWYTEVQALAVKDGPLDQYKLSLQRLLAKVRPTNRMRKLANTLVWTFVKEMAGILARTERLKSREYRAQNRSFVSSFRIQLERVCSLR